MKILIIGGTGVLSRAIAAMLAQAGQDVTILTDGRGVLSEPPGIEEHFKADRNSPEQLRHAIESASSRRWDLVVDCICYSSRQAQDLYKLIGGCAAHIIVISTAIVYDRHAPFPLRADSPIASAEELGHYGLEKIEMEKFWLEAWKDNSAPVTILRLPHILGPGSELGIIPMHNRDPLLIERIRRGHPLILADGGRQVLQFVFADDVARVISAAVSKEVTFGKVYNCSNPDLFTAQEYYREIGSYVGLPVKVLPVPSEVIWQSNWGWSLCSLPRILDIEALGKDIGYIPLTSLSAALRNCLEFSADLPPRQMVDDGLFKLGQQIQSQCKILVDYVDACEPKRIRTPVDTRMNTLPSRLR